MSGNGSEKQSAGKEAIQARIKAREQAELITGLRKLARGPRTAPNGSVLSTPTPADELAKPGEEACDMCGKPIPADHRHLLHLEERRIICTCESCLAMRAGDRELRPTGTRFVWLEDFDLPDEDWATFSIPIGLAFFMHSTVTKKLTALYPSPAGATESELELDTWVRLTKMNPILGTMEADIEALIVNRMTTPHEHVIAPIDECYRLVGMIKMSWEGISGGVGPEQAIAKFFAEMREKAQGAPA
jgi:hypothetical protein